MPVEVFHQPSRNQWPLRVRAPKPSPRAEVRTIRVGLLGLGQVGQAVARLAADRAAVAPAGIRFHVEQALIRDPEKERRCPRPGRLTTNAPAFLRGNYDVVVDALGGVEPARTLVARLLSRGTSVVTANKALVAEHGADLESVASAHGASFRFEATALSAVPFLGTLAVRPLVASVDRVVGSVGDPLRDVDGLDSADTLRLLTSLLGWGRLSRESLEVRGARGVTGDDLAAARSLGGTIKPLVYAHRDTAGVRAFVGPAFIAASDPLASLSGTLNGIRLDGRHVSNLFFSGPGAGPDVTAATLLDDVAQAASEPSRRRRPLATSRPVFAASPATRWFVRVTFPGIVPPQHALGAVVASAGLYVDAVCDYAGEHSRWLIVGPHGRRDLDTALATLETTHRITSLAFRRV
jgi:homoserine dehydrogenase